MPVGEQIVVSGPLLNMPLGRQSLSPSSCSTFSYGPLSLLCRRVQVVPILGISWLGPPPPSTPPPPLQISMRGGWGDPPLQFQVREFHDELSPLSGNSVVSSCGTSAAPINSVAVWRAPPVVLASERSPVDSREARFNLSASCSTTDGRKSSTNAKEHVLGKEKRREKDQGRLLCCHSKGWAGFKCIC
jgi:hypothetical protein